MTKLEQFKLRGIRQPYSTGPYNKYDEKEQWIRISQVCPNTCSFCYEPTKRDVFPIPEIVRRNIKIMDMNLLSQQQGALRIIKTLGDKRVDGKVVYYQLICGIDWRFLTPLLADALKRSRFSHIRLAWDFSYKDQFKIRAAIKMLLKAGYRTKDITIFMISNWTIHYKI